METVRTSFKKKTLKDLEYVLLNLVLFPGVSHEEAWYDSFSYIDSESDDGSNSSVFEGKTSKLETLVCE